MNTSTAAANVIPYTFDTHRVRTLLIEEQPWFVAKDIISSLEYSKASSPAKLVEHVPQQWKGVNPIHTPGGVQKVLMLSEQGLYFFLGRSDKAKALPFQMWLAGEVLPAIRKHGRYSDDSGKMATLVNDVIGVSGANLIGGVISQKVSVLPVGVQRQARHRMHSVLHTRFNVPRTELIPAEKLDAACQYIASYVLEGEWLESSQAKGMQLSEREVQALYLMMSHYHFAMEWAMKSGIYAIARMTDSRPLSNFNEHFSEIGMGFRTLDERRDEIYRIYSQRGAGGGYAMQAAS